ncbi:MAG: hypothetical protein A3C43_06315 [Candidatus Schekmanbacteria bacterium RIFCSPHIGHO2_02_FULL_38_11]|uniref:Uncharacterized protein n=1 Tax=Candidatus Schekmanbacteria bacterium RIFCSPLOWO2_12_FULL_38_15 TaxID=1817883 RepID=A0A1F7SFC3_9BACT|nr:MAG: hypothetical protein A2043_01760 [Candidatus Schekmanbacteria bacterium GWA2_38_9]OGL48351.1 MAG: hypothetical protein A3H37_05100 [Candidatus Schekmanbacteria bacterium RIFCSPLOWO2_02_FULL_38_14]OGL48487.1 MAG: hypothetical protein A3C43_06315 [Candidatus Schekmanbacteria bacterium RIFCSPHIGHO2_02_FULL_38_11]OGL51877.1 MAG: hypothetical protein A3G31_05705 [Candidatus Schekmanbacteria bacterium RIFCSPLOWO2_12_FULL_38_15]
MQVDLIFPSISAVGFDSFGKGMEESWISHGLCLISAYAKKHGFNPGLIDLRRLKGWEHFAEEIKRRSPDAVGITMMSVDYNPAMKCIKIIKEISPDTKVIVGGPHPSIMVDEVKTDRKIDYIITGEGEISFTKLLEEIGSGGSSQRIIEGEKPDLDSLPFADRELFGDLEFPLPVEGFNPPFVTIIAGRGCIYNCSFCQPAERILFGKKVRRRNVDNVILELNELRKKYNFKSMMIHDDCLTEDRDWVKEFCEKYRENRFTQPFACQTRADIVCNNEDMVKLMADSGLSLYFIGFESGNQRILNFLRKGTKVEHNYRAADICRKYGIKIWANYMFGVPTETKEEVMDTVNMMKAIKPDHYSPAFFTPHHGSDLFAYCEENKLSLIKSHDSFRRNATESKIKGVDYEFLYWAVNESMGTQLPLIKGSTISSLKSKVRPFFNNHPMVKKILKKILEAF